MLSILPFWFHNALKFDYRIRRIYFRRHVSEIYHSYEYNRVNNSKCRRHSQRVWERYQANEVEWIGVKEDNYVCDYLLGMNRPCEAICSNSFFYNNDLSLLLNFISLILDIACLNNFIIFARSFLWERGYFSFRFRGWDPWLLIIFIFLHDIIWVQFSDLGDFRWGPGH